MDIIARIDEFDAYYNHYITTEPPIAEIVAKIAVIESASWIEDRMDQIVLQFHNSISDTDNFGRANRSKVKNRKVLSDILKKSYSIDYERNFKLKLIVPLFGMLMVDKMERGFVGELSVLIAHLDNIKKFRNFFAHVATIPGTGVNPLPTPSVTKNSVQIIKNKLDILEQELIKMHACAIRY